MHKFEAGMLQFADLTLCTSNDIPVINRSVPHTSLSSDRLQSAHDISINLGPKKAEGEVTLLGFSMFERCVIVQIVCLVHVSYNRSSHNLWDSA